MKAARKTPRSTRATTTTMSDALREKHRAEAYAEVVQLLDREIAKSKDNGDLDTAEVFELIRAKVKAHSERPASAVSPSSSQ